MTHRFLSGILQGWNVIFMFLSYKFRISQVYLMLLTEIIKRVFFNIFMIEPRLHALLVERLRYAPVGWSKRFEFSESDLSYACDACDEWLDGVAAGKRNVAPTAIPWDALRTLLQVCA